jgi:hypothetical protein
MDWHGGGSMRLQRGVKNSLLGCVMVWLSVAGAFASPYHGQVTFNGMPLPGSVVTVTATQGDKKVVAVSDDQGLFGFADLADGNWSLDIAMTGFAPLKAQIVVAPGLPVASFEMKLMTLDDMRSAAKPVKVDVTAPVVASVANPTRDDKAVTNGATASGAPASAAPAKGAAAAGAKPAQTASAAGGPAPPEAPSVATATQDSASAQANDGFLINGSVNNAATSQFSLNQAFGNNRGPGRWKYNGGLSLMLNDSALNARPFSLDGTVSPKPPTSNLIAGATFGGPLEIPHLIPYAKAPNFFVNYQRTQSKNESLPSTIVPTAAEISGNLTAAPNVTSIYVPANLQTTNPNCYSYLVNNPTSTQTSTGKEVFANNTIPTACITSVAAYLLKFYPSPNLTASATSPYNYQIPLVGDNHVDSYSGNIRKQFGNKNNLNGNVGVQDSRSSNPNIFGFLDTSRSLGMSVSVGWYHRFTQRLSMNANYNFNRSRSNSYGYFSSNNTNVEGNAGIAGYYQGPNYQNFYGPPGLGFSSGIAGLSDGSNSTTRPEQNAYGGYMTWNHFRHNVTFGGDYKRQEYNYLQQANPRGSLTFTGAQTEYIPPCPAGTSPCPAPVGGSDFADFLLGLPDQSAIAYGNPDKYLRQTLADGYVDDDFRVNPELSIRAGLRWEYGSPVTETKNRLVNLAVGTGFTTETPVVATNPTGPLAGQRALMHPDYSFPEPRIGIAWRPISGSSLLVRSGYGIYNDTSVYRSTALAMAQQNGTVPSSLSQSVSNTAACPFNIAAPFALSCATTTPDSFAVDPNFKVGTAQAWYLSMERDIPYSLHLTVMYQGLKGTHGVQEIAPNSYAPGLTTSPYGSAPSGYYWRDSEGNSTRESGQVQLRRRLRNGLTANLSYTFAKALDDDYSLGGGQGTANPQGGSPQVAQDWQHPESQRGLSTFDQRNVLSATLQYTTGMGIGGHTLMSGWRALAYKEWTVQLNISEASGLPETPIVPGGLNGTGFSNIIRPNFTGAAIHQNLPKGVFLNPGAFVAPSGQFGNARRDSITGPSQFGLNASLDRTWRLHDRYNVEARVDANNVLNHVAYSGWNTTVGSSLYGQVTGAGGMRSLTITIRGRF